MKIDFQIRHAGWQKIPALQNRLKKALEAAVARLPPRLQGIAARAEITLLLTSDAVVRQLNHDFRGMNKPTNVLSFPQHNPVQLVKIPKGKGKIPIGDVALAYQYTVKEADLQCKDRRNHVIHLAVHGFLHLLGYDHGSDKEAAAMEKLERRIMADLGLPDPYATLR